MAKRVQVSVNMASSIDGKIATTARGPVKLGSAYDSRRMAEIRAAHDVIVMGAGTFFAHPKSLVVGPKDLQAQRIRQKLSPQPATAVVSSKGLVPKSAPWRTDYAVERWLFCGGHATARALRGLMVEGIRVSQDFQQQPDPARIIATLVRNGHQRILLEGGGELNAAFFAQDLVDRIYLTLCPLVIGGREAPTICDGSGFLPAGVSQWRLRERRLRSGELYLVFDRARGAWKSLAPA